MDRYMRTTRPRISSGGSASQLRRALVSAASSKAQIAGAMVSQFRKDKLPDVMSTWGFTPMQECNARVIDLK